MLVPNLLHGIDVAQYLSVAFTIHIGLKSLAMHMYMSPTSYSGDPWTRASKVKSFQSQQHLHTFLQRLQNATPCYT